MRDLSSEDDYIPSFNSIVIPLLKSCNYADEKPLISNEVFDDGKTDKTFTSVRCLDFVISFHWTIIMTIFMIFDSINVNTEHGMKHR